MDYTGARISQIISFIACLFIVYGFICWRFPGRHKLRRFFGYIRKSLLAPLYFFCGYTCDICGKRYLFNPHKAFMCCPGVHNEKWRREHPHEKCLTDPSTLTIQQQLKAAYGSDYWKHVNPDHYLRTCPWCGGTGRKYGVMCDECGGSGKLPR